MNGYIQIKLSGQMVGLKFGSLSGQLFSEAITAGKKVYVTIDKEVTLNPLGIAYVLWSGYINNCEVKQTDPVLTLESFFDYVDEANSEDSKEIIKALDAWTQSRMIKDLIGKADEKKKKIVRGMKS